MRFHHLVPPVVLLDGKIGCASIASLDPGQTLWLAGKSTLNRMTHAGKIGQHRHHKLDHGTKAMERLFVDLFLVAHVEPPRRIVIELDATDDPLYGDREGRHFQDYYDCYCVLDPSRGQQN